MVDGSVERTHPRYRRVRSVLGVLFVLVLAAVGAARYAFVRWFAPPSGPRLEVLPPLSSTFRLAGMRLERQGDLPAVDLDERARGDGKFVLFVADTTAFQDPVAMQWVHLLGDLMVAGDPRAPEVQGSFATPDLPRWMRGPPTKLVAKTASEFPFPLRLDFGGVLRAAFEFTEPGPGVVLLGPSGAIVRLGGHVDAAKTTLICEFFGSGPRRFERAPALNSLPGLADLRPAAPVGIVFLARPLGEREAPAFVGSPLGMALAGFEPPADPSVRLVTFFAGAKASSAELVIAGELDGFADKPWRRLTADGELRRAFGIAPGAAALVAIDSAGNLRVNVSGVVPMWRLGAAADVLGLAPP